jgi:peptidyl-prolyl cis-trans isomerase SurA
MKTTYAILGLAAAILMGLLAWILVDSRHTPNETADGVSARNAPAPHAADADGLAHGRAAAEDAPALPPLDCAHPDGDAARSKAGAVSTAQLCVEFQQLAGQQTKADPTTQRVLARKTLDSLVDAQLVAAALAAEQTAVSDADIDAAFAQLPVVQANPDKGVLQEVLRRQGVDLTMIRRDLRRRLELTRLVSARGDVEPRLAEMEQEWQAHPERYQQDGGVQVQAYIARVSPGAPAEAAAKAQETARAFAAAVPNSAPEKLPQELQLQTLPPFLLEPNQLEPDLVAAVAPLQPGQWTQAVRTRAGWMVCKVLERKAGTARSLDEVRQEIAQRLRAGKVLAERNRILAALRSAAAIEVLIDL